MHRCTRLSLWSLALVALCLATFQVSAFIHPEDHEKIAGTMEAKAFRSAVLDYSHDSMALNELPAGVAAQAHSALQAMGIPSNGARIDALGGRFDTLLPSIPMLPATKMAPGQARTEFADLARGAFTDFLTTYQAELNIDMRQLAPGLVTVHNDGRVVIVHMQRMVDSVPVEGSYINATINNSKLNLMGIQRWGDVEISTVPTVSLRDALKIAHNAVHPFKVTGQWQKHFLVLVPTPTEQGYAHRLVWRMHPSIDGELGSWQISIDAHSGELLGTEDLNHYAEVKGGVYPVTNDGVVPDGVEQAGWPMPWINVSTTSGTLTTDGGGNLSATGSMTASLGNGQYVSMNDNCGSSSLTQTDGIDFGTSGGTDCTTPGFGGAGNTHSSRSGFYELNRIKEMGRAQLPGNSWLTQDLTANMNINNSCNAFWNGSTVNFYRSGGGCANTGEIAGVFDHEWGHGMDANDSNPGIASPSGEGIADIYTALRLNDSCIGRNFLSSPCSGNGDPCLTCTGVRDIDYEQRQSGNPHTFTWSNSTCGSSVHCIGGTYAEAVWSLWKRDLPARYGMNTHTAHELVTYLTFVGGGNVGTWFSGSPPQGGCSSTNGYLQYLAADDDNGNINDGTPHMQAIFDAFDRQEIACNTPTVQDSGCAGVPTTAPNVAASAGNQQVSLSWGGVAGASTYEIFRAEGIFGCDFGKVKIGETSGGSWTDTDLQNGRDYSYVVIPVGGSDSCMGPASACDTVQPVGAPDFSVSCTPSASNIEQGQSANLTCNVISSFGYTGNVGLSCSGNPADVSCAFSPSSVSPPANGSASSTLTLSVAGGATVSNYSFDVVANDGSTSRTSGVSVQVTPAGQNGPQSAAYNAGLGAPACATNGSSCDSGSLLEGRGNLGPEANQPNTLDTCTDGGSGSYLSDESNERLVVRTLDLFDMAEGATVEVEATVFAWSTGTSDTLDLYYTADANNPSWTLIGSFTPPGGGIQTITAQYTLPAGSLQAVRANFRYQGSQSPCSTGNYDDADDLVFAVGGAAPGCSVDADCDDGAYCNGTEVCNAGTCEAGTAISCDDGVSCTDDTCNEATDSCDNSANDSNCDNGLFCDGAETCDAVNDCQAGTAPNCDDGVSCTVDSCNEGSDSCDNAPTDSLCDNGTFCDGAETCDAVNGCQAGSDPCAGDACDEAGDVCLECTVDADCDDGLFCNGVETCSGNSCQAGTDPCGGLACNETTDSCEANPPVTVTFTSIGSEDGWVRESNETSNVGGTARTTGSGSRPIRPGDGTQDRQYKSFLSFDTSSIPAGATIQSATVRLRRGTVRGSNPFTSGFGQCRVDVNSGGFGGNTALQSSDFQAAATAVNAATLSAPAANLDWSEGVLNAAGLAAINVNGRTQVRVYFDLDDNDNGSDDHMGYYSGNNSNAANHPQLVVTYVE